MRAYILSYILVVIGKLVLHKETAVDEIVMESIDYSQFKDKGTVEEYSKRITNEKREINQDVFDELDIYLNLLKEQFYK